MSRTARRQSVFVAVFLVVVLFFVTTFQMSVVRGNSMEPTYMNGQVLLVRKRNRFSAPLKHDDVILFRHGRDVLIKRVHYLPGEEVTDDGFLNLRNTVFALGLEDYYEQTRERDPSAPSGERVRLFVPQGYLVVLGDNLRVSEDSRLFGPIPERDLIGSVVSSVPPPYAAAAPLPPRSGRPVGAAPDSPLPATH